jgi:hypothetical protein
VNNITPSIPKAINTNENKNDSNPSKLAIPNRETLPIYRPFTRTAPIHNINNQFQIKYDAVTGR